MKKIVLFFALFGLVANTQAQNKKFRTDSLKVMYHLDAKGNVNVRDSLVVTNNVHADKYYGDGSHLSGVTGSVAEAPVDLVLGADSDINGSGDVVFKAGGVEKARMLNNGNWGLGVSSPTSLLQLHTSGSTALQMTNSITGSTSADGIILSLRADNGNFGLRMLDSLDVFFETDGLERMRIDASGRVLLGHTSTNITGALIANSSIVVANDDSNLVSMGIGGGVASISSSRNPGAIVSYLPLTFWTSGAKRMTIDTTSGHIGLKVTSPASLLHVNQDTFYTAAGGMKITTANTGQALADGASLFFDSSDNFFIKSHQAGYLSLQTDATERVRIGADGHVGIGGAAGTSVALDVTSTDGALRIPRMTQTQRDALTDGPAMQIYSTSTGKFYFRQNAAWDSLGGGGTSDWNKPTSTRLEPITLSDTVRVNKLRVGTSSTAGYVLTMDADGNATPQASGFNISTQFNLIEEFILSPGTSNNGIGEWGWVFTPTSSATYGFGGNIPDANTPGAIQLNSAVSGRDGSLGGATSLLLSASYFFQFRASLGTVAAAADLRVNGGCGDQTTYAGWFNTGDAAFFNFDPDSSANWRVFCVSNGTAKKANTGVLATTNYTVFKGLVNATSDSMYFYINGTKVATVEGVPSGAGRQTGPRFQCQAGAGGGGQFNIDYMWIGGTISR